MSSTLFPDPPSTPPISEPPVWIRRLVLLRQIEPVDIIREIPFELGLNLIVTRQPAADSVDALGHDVGKTLLTRMIRYLLGEARYADSRTRSAIRHAFPDSVIAGELRVGGEDWAVMRPLGAPSTFIARAGQVDRWHQLLEVEESEDAYAAFLQCVSDVVLEPLTSPLLTHARRPVEWLDILSWMARDQKCRYSHPLVWRHTETDSGTQVLHTEDASIILRSVTGMMDHREKVLFEEHDTLLQRRQMLAEEVKQLERQISAEEFAVTSDLQALLQSDGIGISELELELIRRETQKLEDLRAEEIANLNLTALRDKYEAALRASAEAAAMEKSLAAQIEATETHIAKLEERPLSVYERFAALCDKATDDCPAKLKIANQQVPTADFDDVAQLKAELEAHKKRERELQAERQTFTTTLAMRRSELEHAEEQLSTLTAGIDGRVALYSAMDRRVDQHLQQTTRLPQAANEHEMLNGLINESRERQSQLRDSLATTRAWLPKRFSALCEELVGGNRQFELVIESKAIRLNIIGARGAPGEATSTSALVLSLDLAAIQSAMDGYGHHPRLMILDSPREADMEIGIFNRLIRRFVAWHQASLKPTFQLIVTTTTRPQDTDVPSGVIRAELARIPTEDLLLGVEL